MKLMSQVVGKLLTWALFSHLFGSKLLLGTKMIEIGPLLSLNAIT